MVQNISTAVMQRRVEAADSLDDFPTPPWATRAVIKQIIEPIESRSLSTLMVNEPAANRGYMVRPLAESFGCVIASDICDYGHGFAQLDYLRCLSLGHWMITNPPFRLAKQFIEKSFEAPSWRGTAVIVRSAFLEGGGRYEELFSKRPPSIIAQHVERVIMTKGIVRDPAKEYWDEAAGKMRRPSTATSYCWLIWMSDIIWIPEYSTKFRWITPCRKQMERPGDYPE